MAGMPARYLSYGGGLCLLLAVVLVLVASEERRYESTVSRVKGIVIGKAIRRPRIKNLYGVTYRVTIQGKTLDREGDVGSQNAWNALRIGDEVDVDCIGVTANETRMPVERLAGSGVYHAISAALAVAGVGLLVWRFRGGRLWSAAKPPR